MAILAHFWGIISQNFPHEKRYLQTACFSTDNLRSCI